MAKIKGVSLGEIVYWIDPEGYSNDWYKVATINGKENADDVNKEIAKDYFSWEDAIIGLESDCGSYAEVYLSELRFGKSKSKRKCA